MIDFESYAAGVAAYRESYRKLIETAAAGLDAGKIRHEENSGPVTYFRDYRGCEELEYPGRTEYERSGRSFKAADVVRQFGNAVEIETPGPLLYTAAGAHWVDTANFATIWLPVFKENMRLKVLSIAGKADSHHGKKITAGYEALEALTSGEFRQDYAGLQAKRDELKVIARNSHEADSERPGPTPTRGLAGRWFRRNKGQQATA